MPGLIRGVARTAVIAGTATAVSNRVRDRPCHRRGRPMLEAPLLSLVLLLLGVIGLLDDRSAVNLALWVGIGQLFGWVWPTRAARAGPGMPRSSPDW